MKDSGHVANSAATWGPFIQSVRLWGGLVFNTPTASLNCSLLKASPAVLSLGKIRLNQQYCRERTSRTTRTTRESDTHTHAHCCVVRRGDFAKNKTHCTRRERVLKGRRLSRNSGGRLSITWSTDSLARISTRWQRRRSIPTLKEVEIAKGIRQFTHPGISRLSTDETIKGEEEMMSVEEERHKQLKTHDQDPRAFELRQRGYECFRLRVYCWNWKKNGNYNNTEKASDWKRLRALQGCQPSE